MKNLVERIREARDKADSGDTFSPKAKWPGNENLQYWINSYRNDNIHTPGDGIGSFVKHEDAQFSSLAFNHILKLCSAIELFETAMRDVEVKGQNGFASWHLASLAKEANSKVAELLKVEGL